MSAQRVLLIDDDPLILQAYRRSLGRRFTVDIAEGPHDGLAKLRTTACAVVVADMLMPGMTGLQLLEEMRQFSPQTVGVLLSGMGDYQQALASINEGFVYRFLSKPCPTELLVRCIQDSLEYHRLLTQNDSVQTMLRALAQHQARIRPGEFPVAGLVRQLAESLELPRPGDFETAAHLCSLAQSQEQELYQSLAELSPLAEVVKMASLPPAPWNQCLPENLSEAPRAQVGAHLLDLARRCAQSHQHGHSPLQTLQSLSTEHYHPAALASLARLTG